MNGKVILSFLAGAGVGAFIGYKVAEKRLNEKFNKLRERDVEDINRIRYEMLQSKKQGKKTNYSAKETTDDTYPVNYNNVRLRYSKDGEYIDNNEEDEPVAEAQVAIMEHPYQITDEEYANQDNYECESWTYYKGNDTMVDFNGEPVVDYRQYIEHVLDNCLNDDDLSDVYVRNEKLMTDYEILTTDSSYEYSD